jgi:NitT/TauT family transport system ATP-binding protein
MSNISIDHVTLNYNEKHSEFTALQDVSFQVNNGEFVSVIGASGCGKSTLLNILAGLNAPTQGCILVDGKKIEGPGLDRGVVFQNYSLFPWMTARKNVSYAVKQAYRKKAEKKSRKECNKIADTFLEKVGLSEFGNKYPSQLSGGMQQRVAIAKTLAMDTPVLLMDEPFSAIDAKNRVALQNLLLQLWEGEATEEKKTIIFVTHDIDEAIILSDRIVMMTHTPGRVYKEFKVPFKHPRNREELAGSAEYKKFRSKIVEYFYSSMKADADVYEIGEYVGEHTA